MKNLARIMVVFMLLALAFSAVSCAGETPEETFAETFEKENVADFGGKELSYVGMEREGRIEIDPWQESEDSFWGDMLRARYSEIENKYNVDISIRKDDGLLSAYTMSGLHWADFYEAREDTIRPFVQGGMIFPLNGIEDFMNNIDEGMWGTEYDLEIMMRGDEYFGFYPAFHGIPFKHMGGILYANNTVLKRYGYNPIEMIESGAWTWDNFEKILIDIGNNYDDPEADVGFVISSSFPQYVSFEAILSNGTTLVKKDGNGKLICNMSDNRVSEALNWCRHLVADNIVTYGSNSGYNAGGSGEYAFPRFTENKCAFWAEYSYVGTVDANGFMYNDVDFFLLPFPCGPSGTYGEWAGYVGGPDVYFAVPFYADTDMVDAVLYDMYSPLGEDKYSWREEFSKYNFMHEESAKLYYLMGDNARPMYEGATEKFSFSTVLAGTTTVEAAIQEYSDQIQAVLDENYNNY